MFPSFPTSPRRRAVLGLGSAAALSAVLPVGRAEARPGAAPAGLAPAGRAWIRGARLRHSTVLQSFAFDERHGLMYALQVMGGGVRLPGEPRAHTHAERAARGDLCLNRLTMDGTPTGYMYLLGFGHGGALGVEDSGRRASALWTEWDAHPGSGFGRGICRFGFTEGRVLTRTGRGVVPYRPVPGSTGSCVTLAPVYDRLLRPYARPAKMPSTSPERQQLLIPVHRTPLPVPLRQLTRLDHRAFPRSSGRSLAGLVRRPR